MKTQLFSLSKIFAEKLLRIPDYQRGYAWTEKQLKEFWGDLIQLEECKNHYIGVLTLEDVPNTTIQKWEEDHWIIKSKSFAPFYVVDGQQRLTTSIILIQAITESIPDGRQLNYTTAEKIREKFIYESKDGGISRSYIFGYEKDNPSYEFLKTQVFMEASDNYSDVQETIYTHNLGVAKNFFLQKIKELSFEELEKLYKKLTQNFLFNIYSISDDVDVFVAFETMNNRGKPLSHLELLKNRLIYLSTKFDEEDYEKNKLRHCINETWKTVYHYLGKNKSKPLNDDLFLRHHFLHYFGHDPIKEMTSSTDLDVLSARQIGSFDYKDYLLEFKFTVKNINLKNASTKERRLTVGEIYSYVNSLKDAIKVWYCLFNPTDSPFTSEEKQWLEKLNRVGASLVMPLMMAFYLNEPSPKARVKLLKALEKLMFLLSSGRFPAGLMLAQNSIHHSFMHSLSHQLNLGNTSSEKVIKQVEQTVETILANKSFSITLADVSKREGFYGWRNIKYLLFEYELELKEPSKNHRDKLVWQTFAPEDDLDHKTIEHIYPQRPKHPCWIDSFSRYTDRERTILRHTLGNLVPLSQPKNSSFQNKCFVDKKGSGDSKVGFRYGSYSENEIAENECWTAKEILFRGLKLLEFLERRWKVDLGNKQDKVKILCLDFVLQKEKITLD